MAFDFWAHWDLWFLDSSCYIKSLNQLLTSAFLPRTNHFILLQHPPFLCRLSTAPALLILIPESVQLGAFYTPTSGPELFWGWIERDTLQTWHPTKLFSGLLRNSSLLKSPQFLPPPAPGSWTKLFVEHHRENRDCQVWTSWPFQPTLANLPLFKFCLSFFPFSEEILSFFLSKANSFTLPRYHPFQTPLRLCSIDNRFSFISTSSFFQHRHVFLTSPSTGWKENICFKCLLYVGHLKMYFLIYSS